MQFTNAVVVTLLLVSTAMTAPHPTEPVPATTAAGSAAVPCPRTNLEHPISTKDAPAPVEDTPGTNNMIVYADCVIM
ncbi:hypothetical protein IWQ60_003978 [Tieghemiomyces parasiticus]|uniref:Pheromone n=1 Tax=Tieghemiomyces parasiticus TaxID=78921 RepID=A0A9W8A8N3_9FUNG|nr:hypothetical protein IWQ60_003978 [Tieghemiomyces parasiticus]